MEVRLPKSSPRIVEVVMVSVGEIHDAPWGALLQRLNEGASGSSKTFFPFE